MNELRKGAQEFSSKILYSSAHEQQVFITKAIFSCNN